MDVRGFIIKCIFITVYLVCLIHRNVQGLYFTPGGKIAVYRLYRQCPQYPILPWQFEAIMKKYNRTTTVLDGHMNLTTDFDDTQSFELEARRWSDGGWKRNHMYIKRNKACSSIMLFYGDLLKEQIIATGKKDINCPVPKGYYAFKNLPQTLTSPLFIGSGTFNNTIIIRDKENKMLFCQENVLEIMDVIKKKKNGIM